MSWGEGPGVRWRTWAALTAAGRMIAWEGVNQHGYSGFPFPAGRSTAESSLLSRRSGERRVLESPAGGGAGPAERRGVSSAASGRRAARATVAGLPAAGEERLAAESRGRRSRCLSGPPPRRAGAGPQPCLVSGLITAAPAGRPARSGGPRKTGQERLGAPPWA